MAETHPLEEVSPMEPEGVTTDQLHGDLTARLEDQEILDRIMAPSADQPLAGSAPEEPGEEGEESGGFAYKPVRLEDVEQSRRNALGGVRAFARSIPDIALQIPLGFGEGVLNKPADLARSIDTYIHENIIDLGFMGFDPNEEPWLRLPEGPDPATAGGAIARSMAQFLGGFAIAKRVSGPLSLAAKAGGIPTQLGVNAVQGGIADFLAFGGHEKRLSDVIESIPALQNPVTEFLSVDEDDPEVIGRIKNVLEGAAMGVLADSFVVALRGVRAHVRARAAAKGEGAEDAIQAAVRDFEVLDQSTKIQRDEFTRLIGDADAEEIVPIRAIAKGVEEGAESPEIFVNWARINNPEDVIEAEKALVKRNARDIKAAQRGKITHAETKLTASQLDAWEVLRSKKGPGATGNAEEVTAIRQLWAASSSKIKELSAMAEANPSPVNDIALRKMLLVHKVIQERALGVQTEAARTLSAYRIPVGDTISFSGQMDELEMALRGERKSLRKIARGINLLADAGMDRELDEFVGTTAWAKTKEAVLQGWYFSLLSGPQTHLRNIVSQTGVIGLELANRRVARLIGSLIGSDAIPPGEAKHALFGLFQGGADAFRITAKGRKILSEAIERPGTDGARLLSENAEEFGSVWRAMATGETGIGIGKIDMPRVGALDPQRLGIDPDSGMGHAFRMADSVTRAPGKALGVEDEVYKSLAFQMEIESQALRKVEQELATGALGADPRAASMGLEELYRTRLAEIRGNPDEYMRLAGIRNAELLTFTGTPHGRIYDLMHSFRKLPVIGPMVQPFTRVAYNLPNFAFKYTPFAPLTPSFREAFRKGGADAQLASARFMLGSIAWLSMVDLALRGHISGEGPMDPGERAALSRSGWKPMSINPPGQDISIPIRGLDPFAFILGTAGTFTELMLNREQDFDEVNDSLTETGIASAFAIANQFTSAQYMTGFSNFFEAMNEPTRYSETWWRRFGSSMVPVGLRQVNRGMFDDYARETTSILDAWKASTPGLSKSLPPRRDLWGRPISFKTKMGSFLDTVSPIRVHEINMEPVDGEMLNRLEAFIRMPRRQQTFDGVVIDLDRHPGAYSRLLELAGNKLTHIEMGGSAVPIDIMGMGAKDTLNAIVTGNHPESFYYDRLSVGPEGDAIRFLRDKYRSFMIPALDVVMEEYPDIRAKVEAELQIRQEAEFESLEAFQ